MSVLQKESTPFPRKRQPSAEGGEDVNKNRAILHDRITRLRGAEPWS